MSLAGKSIVGSGRSESQGTGFRGINPATGESLDPEYRSAIFPDVDRACRLAADAFEAYGRASGKRKGEFLRRIAAQLEAGAAPIIARAQLETALPAPRLQGEMGRTCHQLRLFAELVEEGSWVEARIDHADPQRQPLPKPDVRSMLRPLGTVAVFGSSNFPLAFSVAGGDTASALAAGCPVVVKAHPAHPGTSELSGLAVQAAVQACGLPEGVFSLLFDAGYEIGQALVRHPAIRAAGFTGSRKGGKSLVEAAAARPEPIPVYAEMSSINPVFVLPQALRLRAAEIAAGLHASVTLGVGQFCTNPGLIVVEAGEAAQGLLRDLKQRLASTPAAIMLTAGICAAYSSGVDKFAGVARVRQLAGFPAEAPSGKAAAALFLTTAPTFLAHPDLMDEVFGPSTLVVQYDSREELLALAGALEGQLTATVHGIGAEMNDYRDLLAILETKAGRLICNGYPTGVEVCHAMVHGGPYPATSDGRSTSVGTRAIRRFARPVCFQDFPDEMLPDALKETGAAGIWRLVDGRWQKSNP